MPSQEGRFREQDAVLFAYLGQDRYGEPRVDSGTEIKVRYNTMRRKVLDPDGKTITLDGSAVVNQEVAVNSLLFIGTLSEWVGTGSSLADNELLQVKTYNDTPDIKNRASFKELGLMRFRNTMPTGRS